MITVCLTIHKNKGYPFIRKIRDFKTISGLKETIKYISKYDDVEKVDISFRDKKDKEDFFNAK